MSKYNHIIFKNLLSPILYLLFLILNSCTAPVDIKTNDSPPVISIYGCFTDESKKQHVTVSLSSPYFDSRSNQAVSGADVKVESSSGEVFILAEDPARPGRYQTPNDTAAIPGTTYTLTVKVDNNGVQELYSAISTMPAAMTLDFIRIKSVTQMGRKSYSLSIYAQDPPEEDYYLGIYQINDSLFDKISKYTLMDDKRFNGQYLDGWQFKQFGTVDEDDEDDDPTHLKQGDAVTLYFSRVEKGYYDFIHQCRNEMNGESPFSGPAANITTNISGGAAGYFTAYAVSKATAVLE